MSKALVVSLRLAHNALSKHLLKLTPLLHPAVRPLLAAVQFLQTLTEVLSSHVGLFALPFSVFGVRFIETDWLLVGGDGGGGSEE